MTDGLELRKGEVTEFAATAYAKGHVNREAAERIKRGLKLQYPHLGVEAEPATIGSQAVERAIAPAAEEEIASISPVNAANFAESAADIQRRLNDASQSL